MFRLRRLYLDSIGVPENRFADLLVELTDTAGEPTDAIVWLRNGAGKTTMLSLLLALILPSRNDFLATRTKKRTLEDLIQGGDTAHVAAEWVDPAGQLLLTGAVYEWDGRVRPRDYNGQGKNRLKKSWWCVRPDPTVEGATLDDLPFTKRSHGRYDRDRFRAHITDLAAQGVNAVVADQTIAEWHSALRERRFDPDLFHYFTEVNAAEGGIDGLFAGIDSPGAFVRYLLRFVGDKQRVEPVRQLLAETATEIAKRPVYIAEREFCVDARPKIIALGEAHQAVLAATEANREVIQRAAGYKRALLDAKEIAAARHETAQTKVADLDTAITARRAAVDAARRRRDQYRWLAADFRVSNARDAVYDAEDALEEAESLWQAWAATGAYIELRIRQAELRTQEELLRDASTEARPLMETLETARAVLAGALDNEIRKADESVEVQEAAAEAADDERAKADDDRTKANAELVRLDGETDSLHEKIADFDKQCAALVTAEVLGKDENLAAAELRLDQERRKAQADIDTGTKDRDKLTATIAAKQPELPEARTATGKAERNHHGLETELGRLSRRATELADSPRLRNLLQSDAIDLTEEAQDALDTLARAVAAADLELTKARDKAARDERAIRSLKSTGLLPPRLEVERVVDQLDAAGVTAHPGWRYLAEHVPVADHADRIAELPEVVDGVVVYGDPANVAAHLSEPVDDLVVLSPATEFHHRRAARVVVGPADAQHDPEAGQADLDRREKQLADDARRAADLTEQRDTDSTLRSAILAFTNEFPHDGIAGLRGRVHRAAESLTRARDREQSIVDVLKALDEQLSALDTLINERQKTLIHIKAVLPQVTALAATERDVVQPARLRLDAIPDEQRRARERLATAKTRYADAETSFRELKLAVATLRKQRNTWASQRESLPRSIPTDTPLDAASAAVDEAELLLRERFPEDELRRAVERSRQATEKAAKAWTKYPENVRRHATELANTPEGADADMRAEAVARAKDKSDKANQAVGQANNDLTTAQKELEATPQSRLRATDIVDEPTDRDHALRLAAESEAEAVDQQQQQGQHERDKDEARQIARTAQARVGMLVDQAELLRQVEPADEPVGAVPDDDASTRAAVKEMTAQLDKARTGLSAAESKRAHEVHLLGLWAGQDKFASVAEDEHGQAVHRLREMFRSEHVVERVAVVAVDLAADLETRAKAIAQQLAQVETHKNNVVVRLSDLVTDALGLLGRASALSELPEGIGPWAHRRFLNVEAHSQPSREQIVLRVGELVDGMVRQRKIELDAVELLWRATEASVVDGFRATVLKPAPDQPTGRTPVEEMRKWSGGENLTASLVLFCVLARLRAEQRTGARAGSAGGLVPLDNPVGKANYLPFLDLQRRVAHANGVQLVFWTGIGDLGAVTTFPRIAAMHKRPSTTRPGRAYVQVDADNSQVVDVVSAVRGEP